jgi:hypothetical protein
LVDTSKNFCAIEHYFENDKSNKYKNSAKWGSKNFKNEMTLVNTNIPYMYEYLKQKGINLFIIGKQSFVNNKIPRIYLS